MLQINKYGLSRHIPDDIKLAVRQRCGFGCVVCGNAVFQYEHFDPPFKDAKAHNALGITLLCGGCHDRKTRGVLSKASVRAHNEAPRSKAAGYAWGAFDVGPTVPDMQFGDVCTEDVSVVLRVFGEDVLRVDPPEEPGGPFRLSARIRDRTGHLIFRIDDNEWKTRTQNWDVNVLGQRIKIRRAPGDIVMVTRTDPPNKLIFERMNLNYRYVHVFGRAGEHLTFESILNGSYWRTEALTVKHCDIALEVTRDSVDVGVWTRPGACLAFGDAKTGRLGRIHNIGIQLPQSPQQPGTPKARP